jgi:hypothetical protein
LPRAGAWQPHASLDRAAPGRGPRPSGAASRSAQPCGPQHPSPFGALAATTGLSRWTPLRCSRDRIPFAPGRKCLSSRWSPQHPAPRKTRGRRPPLFPHRAPKDASRCGSGRWHQKPAADRQDAQDWNGSPRRCLGSWCGAVGPTTTCLCPPLQSQRSSPGRPRVHSRLVDCEFSSAGKAPHHPRSPETAPPFGHLPRHPTRVPAPLPVPVRRSDRDKRCLAPMCNGHRRLGATMHG